MKARRIASTSTTQTAKIIWDAGVPPDWEQRWAPYGLNELLPVDTVTDDMWLEARLHQLGLEPQDVDYLLLSHLHVDHRQADLWAGTDTKVVVSQAERDGAFGYDGPSLGGHVLSDYDRLDFTTVQGDTEILPGVTLLQTPGHTWGGTMSLKVDLPDSGTLIFTSDAVVLDENYEPPAAVAGIVWDSQQWFASVEKIRTLAEKHDAAVVFGHSSQQLRRMRTTPGAYT